MDAYDQSYPLIPKICKWFDRVLALTTLAAVGTTWLRFRRVALPRSSQQCLTALAAVTAGQVTPPTSDHPLSLIAIKMPHLVHLRCLNITMVCHGDCAATGLATADQPLLCCCSCTSLVFSRRVSDDGTGYQTTIIIALYVILMRHSLLSLSLMLHADGTFRVQAAVTIRRCLVMLLPMWSCRWCWGYRHCWRMCLCRWVRLIKQMPWHSSQWSWVCCTLCATPSVQRLQLQRPSPPWLPLLLWGCGRSCCVLMKQQSVSRFHSLRVNLSVT